MKKVALIYSFNSTKTAKIAEKIIKDWADEKILIPVNAENIDENSFMEYDQMILGVPTWFDGELPNYWDEFVPTIDDLDLKGKSFAIYGLGDQVNYAENFLDAVGIMAQLLESRGGKIVGNTSAEGYSFEKSKAFIEGKCLGLGIDYENQHQLTDSRIKNWVKQLKEEFAK
jgi:flavodoxin I